MVAHLDNIGNAQEQQPDPAREANVARRNRILLVILLVIITVMALSSYKLFNNYWDPTQSDQVISH